jgi:medium-chain acyl-[acyl-carrier-protein] hydrolase
MSTIASSLIFTPKPKPNALVRLVCFSYAGGSSATYITWHNDLDPNIELAVVQLPGRGAKLSEPPYQTMSEMVTALFLALEKLSNKPFIFYGHSMGARVAYELTLMLRRFRYRLPIHFIASGSIAPCVERTKEPTYHLPDNEFIMKVGELNGSPPEVLANKEIMQLILPALRADFKIIETYHNNSKCIIPTKVSVIAGDQENIEIADVEAWFALFEARTEIHWVNGCHFFVEKSKVDVLKIVNALIGQEISLIKSNYGLRSV